MSGYSTEQLTDCWEHQREIKNLMGRYVNDLMLNRDGELFSKYWAQQAEDVCLGLNDGWYLGADEVKRYYGACADRIGAVNKTLREIFPEQLGGMTEAETYGVGTFRVNPLTSAVIEVAADGDTAKGLWCCFGSKAETGTCGPTSAWLCGYYAADFRWENDAWKIWHMQYLLDVDCTCGQSWGTAVEAYDERPEFAALKNAALPEPTEKTELRRLYTPERPLAETPRLPEPYETFCETFSYGREVRV